MAYIQLWNPENWKWDNHANEARQTKNGEVVRSNWSCGIRKNYEIGERVFLFRVESDHGIIASGHIADETFEAEHWDGSGELTLYVPIDFDVVLDLHEILPREELEARVPFNWRSLMGSGKEIAGDAESALEDLWTRHLETTGRA